jgi:pimeloyl-ACP methyl ester carboxylesterase
MATFVLIPGAGGAGWYWHRMVPELRARGHDAMAVDLPGDDDSARLERYVETVLEAIRDSTELVVVGQSLGAYTATVVCDRVPAQLLILLNPMIPVPGESPGEWWENTGQPQAMQEHAKKVGLGSVTMDDLDTLFGHDVPPEVWADAANHARNQAGRVFGEAWPLDAWPDVPKRVLVSRDDRLFPIEFQRRVVRERLGFEPDEMDGGHLVALSRPVEVAERFDAFAADAGRGGGRTTLD